MYQHQKLQFNPGIVRDSTNYANSGGWWDCNLVRFRNGLPERMGGWERFTNNAFDGTARCIYQWQALDQELHTFIGTETACYVETGSEIVDITPSIQDDDLTDKIGTTDGSDIITIVDSSAPTEIVAGGRVVIAGSSDVGGIAADDINGVRTITDVDHDTHTYSIQAGASATSTVSDDGGDITVSFLLPPGDNFATIGLGWGVNPWGTGAWGEAASTDNVSSGNLAVWSVGAYGEDLILCRRGSQLFYYDTSAGGRATLISANDDASDVPLVSLITYVSERDRHAFVLGTNTLGTTTFDPLLIRWSDIEDPYDWTPTDTNQAGDYRLAIGSKIVAKVATKIETVIFTDSALYSQTYIGGEFVFSHVMIGTGITIAGQNAAINYNDTVYWMGRGGFYTYGGQIAVLDCPLNDFIVRDVNWHSADKIVCGKSINFNEVIWFYQSNDSTTDEIDKYVIYNVAEGSWYFGSLSRTAWYDSPFASSPLAAGTDGYVYQHEMVDDDGSTNPPTAIDSYIESSPIELGNGDEVMQILYLMPDLTFRDAAIDPTVDFTIKAKYYPGDSFDDDESGDVVRIATVPVEKFTRKCDLRIRGRMIAVRIESNTIGAKWRLGVPRLYMRPDGRR